MKYLRTRPREKKLTLKMFQARELTPVISEQFMFY